MGFWLPKLISSHDVKSENGISWVRDKSGNALSGIFRGIDIANIGVQIVESVPSMWARATLFDAAVSHQDGKTCTEVDKKLIGEWRGALTLLAFSHLSQFKISYVPVDFNNDPELQKFKNLLPRNTILTDSSWNNIYLILYNNKPFAFTSPTTLICTGTDYSQVFSDKIQWFDGEKLTDPCSKLNNLHKKLLAYWLLNLQEQMTRLTDIIDMNNLMYKRIIEMLKNFRSDLGYAVIDKNTDPDPNQYTSNLPHINHSLYSTLTIPLDYQTDTSDIMLINKRGSAEHILLYAKMMLNRTSNNVIIFGATTLNMLDGVNFSERTIGLQNLGQYHLFEGKEWLFNDEVYLVEEDQMQPEYRSKYALCWNINDETKNVMMIYPFKEHVLECLDIDYIKQNTFVETLIEDNEKKLAVKIILKLSGGMQEFKRIYNASEIHAFMHVPLAAVWPAYDLGTNWNLYYFYNHRPYRTMEYGDFTMVPYGATELQFVQDEVPTEVYTTTSYPQVILVKYNGLDAGFIPMIKPIEKIDNIQPYENKCLIGVDFGTCSSTVYYSTDRDTAPRIFKYPQRSKTITKSIQNEFNFWEQFLPFDSSSPVTIDRYFHTLFRYYNNSPEDAIVHGNIFYSYDIADPVNLNFGGIASNLKWGSDKSISAICAKPFLEQIVIQTLLELILLKIDVNSTTWFFSYPTALPKFKADSFRNNLSQIVKKCYIKILDKDNGNDRSRHGVITESVAAARYFLGTNAGIMNNLSGGFVSIDIGGGTTDISFWQQRTGRGSYVYQTSVKFASRSLFIEPLRESKHRDYILEALGLNKSLRSNYKERALAIEDIELSLSKNKKAYEKLGRCEEEQEIKNFIETISFGVAGLFYFTGMLIRKMYDDGEIKDFAPNIYFGGNGSNVFNWLNNGSVFDNDAYRAELYREMVKAASNTDRIVRINISTTPKAEAAGGMVVQKVAIEENAELENDKGIVLGENMTLDDGMELSWNCVIDETLMEKDINTITLDNVMNFIHAYNTAYKKMYNTRHDIINYSDFIHTQLVNSVKDEVNNMKNSREWNKPLFLSAIEILVKDAGKIDLIQI